MQETGIIKIKPLLHDRQRLKEYISVRIKTFPWWLLGILLIAILTAITIATKKTYLDAFNFIKVGLTTTITTTMASFLIALIIGLVTGLGRISNSTVFKNISTFYVEIIRGIPMLVLIFFIALVGVPAAVDSIKVLGDWLIGIGLTGLGGSLASMQNNAVSMNNRAIVALSVTYGAFLAEIFRAGIQSIGRGQMEAARSQGMSYWQAMRYIILPQAIKNVLPALGNDFISMLKDSSLVSVLAVRDITQIAKLYAGRSFQYQQAYITLAVLYLTMTMLLSFLMKYIERRTKKNEQK